LATGQSVAGARAGISGSGLMPDSPYTLVMHSQAVVVATGHADGSGAFRASLLLPGKACVHGGQHQLTLTGMAPSGRPVTDTDWIVLDDTCHSQGSFKSTPGAVRHEETFLFDYLSAKLTPAGVRTLTHLATTLRTARFLIITGYTQTDLTSIEARRANVVLARRRAMTVKRYLQRHGVRARFALVAAGPVNPVSTRKQRLNRRVTITSLS
jgi:outer membrane protein OmpA-like peptidoglycan-associated protein